VDAAVGAQSGNGHMSGLHHVRAGRGTHFDPTIVDVLLAAEAEIAALYDSFG
jgi:response regulator RpfG family c-di-GMP phosphodiesterase